MMFRVYIEKKVYNNFPAMKTPKESFNSYIKLRFFMKCFLKNFELGYEKKCVVLSNMISVKNSIVSGIIKLFIEEKPMKPSL